MIGWRGLSLSAAVAVAVLSSGGALGLRLGEPRDGLACRPSNPEHLPPGPKVLILGNSLAFDADWRLELGQAVNCARQGLTAAEAVPLIGALPEIAPVAVILVFGTVELGRGHADPEDFLAALTAIAETLREGAPDAALVALGVPAGDSGWAYDVSDARALNAALERLDDVDLLQIDPVLARHDGPVSYDGFHLSPAVYGALRHALDARLTGVGVAD